jgi:hypothetical protein
MGQDHLEEITRPITGGGDGATSSELTGNAIFIANLGVSDPFILGTITAIFIR